MFTRAPVVSFDQIYFDPAVAGPEDVAAAKAALRQGGNPAAFGQASMLPRQIRNNSLDLVARDYGNAFAAQVKSIPVGEWAGPLASGIGVHLVRVRSRSAPELPPLDQVRKAVSREWESDRRTRAKDDSFRKLREEYDVVVEAKLPPPRKP
jgi:parvulin-like peptidyl-prolyl isomerase